ncbi:MAG: metal ABC transporter solute-binding protein, Zn/Mn family [Bacteroidales bacterium]
MKLLRFTLPIIILLTILLQACQPTSTNKPIVAVTILPQKYFAEVIAGEIFDIFCVVPQGSSPESFDPSPSLIMQLGKSVGYLQIGQLGFELAWMGKIKQNNPNLEVFKLDNTISPIIGGHACNDPNHNHDHSEGVDPHYWSSPKAARKMAVNMCDAFIQLKPEYEELFKENLETLLLEIDQTDQLFANIVSELEHRTFMIFHPSLAYIARDYNLEQIAIEDNGKEPTPSHLRELIDRARRDSVKVVFIQQEFDIKNAEIVAKESGASIIQIDPLSFNWSEEIIKIAKSIANGE